MRKFTLYVPTLPLTVTASMIVGAFWSFGCSNKLMLESAPDKSVSDESVIEELVQDESVLEEPIPAPAFTQNPVSKTLDTLSVTSNAPSVATYNTLSEASDTLSATTDTLHVTFDTLRDARDGKKYLTTVIGGRTWMATNLNYQPQSGNSWCYENDTSNCGKYGRLYDWNTAKEACPAGWHLPFGQEWDSLALTAGGERQRRLAEYDYIGWRGAGKMLKARSGWKSFHNKNGNGADIYGFSASPGGYRDNKSGGFYNSGYYGYWWTAAWRDSARTHARTMDYDIDYVFEDDGDKRNGYSARCVQDESAEKEQARIEEARKRIEATQIRKDEEESALEKLPTYFTDSRDGREYRAVEIGGKMWMAENLNYGHIDETNDKAGAVIRSGSSWCYNNDTSNCDKYGRLYDWPTAMTACPYGWHLPSIQEVDSLGRAIGGAKFDNKLKTKSGWHYDDNGTDDFGFSALPTGIRNFSGRDDFEDIGKRGHWWTAAYSRGYNIGKPAVIISYHTSQGLSVRCVQDENKDREKRRREREQRKTEERQRMIKKSLVHFTDSRDNREYRAIEIGGKTWMAENLNYWTPNGSWCNSDSSSNCKKYGRLYDWKTATTVCPPGWHLPSRHEWNALLKAVGGERQPTNNNDDGIVWYGAAKVLKAKTGWEYADVKYIADYNGTDDYGFSALPGGEYYNLPYYRNDYGAGYWWTSSYGNYYTYYITIGYDNAAGVSEKGTAGRDYGYSVRCVAD